MIMLFLGLLLINCVFLMFSYTYQLNGINRVIIAAPIQLFETSIPLATQDKEVTLYYEKETLKHNYETYLEKELTKYTSSYEVQYYFYNTNNGGFCDEKDCQGVEIDITAKIMLWMDYERVMKYEIVKGKING